MWRGGWLRRGLSTTTTRKSYDVVIVGGGVVGSCIALQLKLHDEKLRVCVVERDATYERCSAVLSAGGLRQQFGLAENVALSMYGAEWLRDLSEDPGFRENGYLTLATRRETLEEAHRTQQDAGAHWISFLGQRDLEKRFPWLETEGLVAGTFGEANEGYFDAYSFLKSTVAGAKAKGVQYVQGSAMLQYDDKLCKGVQVDEELYEAATYVVAAGAGTGRLVPDVPVVPRLRSIFVVRCDDPLRPPPDAPLVVDPTGLYYRADAGDGRFLCGVSPSVDPDVDFDTPLNVDYDLFDDVIWPTLAERVPAFASLRLQSAWAGLYDMNPLDHNAVIGFHPSFSNLVVAAGFSGHGLQHAPGVGRGVAELLTCGAYQTIDLTPFSFARILEKRPLREHAIY